VSGCQAGFGASNAANPTTVIQNAIFSNNGVFT
jgi:hypothetical protein